jgi:GntR family transcriptional regulator
MSETPVESVSRRVAPAEPAYRVLANDLRTAILAGDFPPTHRLPTEVELAADRGVSRQTVRQAYAQLVAETLVHRVRGRGSFATPFATKGNGAYLRSFGSVDDLMALSVDTELEVISPLERRADVAAAGRLQLTSDEVMAITFSRFHEGVVFCVTAAFLPVDIGRRLASAKYLTEHKARTRKTVIDLIEKTAGVSIAGANQSVTAEAADARLAILLECEPGDPVLRIDRIYFDHDGRYVELAVSHLNPSRYSYRLELHRSPA